MPSLLTSMLGDKATLTCCSDHHRDTQSFVICLMDNGPDLYTAKVAKAEGLKGLDGPS